MANTTSNLRYLGVRGPFHATLLSFAYNLFPAELSHLDLLKSASLYAHEACDVGQSKTGESAFFYYIFNTFSISTGRTAWYSDKSKRSKDYLSIGRKEFSSNNELAAYEKHWQSSHFYTKLASENTLLTHSNDDPDLPFYLALCEPAIQTSLLIDAMEVHIDRLSEPKVRSQLTHMLIKMIDSKEGLSSPFIDSLRREPQLLKKFEHLIKSGRKHFVDSMPVQNPRLEEMLFLIRQYSKALQVLHALKLGHGYPTDETICLVKELVNFLDAAAQLPVKESVKQDIQVAKVGLLLGLPLSKLQHNHRVELFHSYLQLKQILQSRSDLTDYPFWRECQTQFFNSQEWSQILINQRERADFANAVLERICGVECQKWKFEFTPPRLVGIDQLNKKWIIDLQQPAILHNQVELLQKFDCPIDATFSRLFSNRRYHFHIFGNQTFFQDPIWGLIKMTQEDNECHIEHLIQGKWCTYIPNRKIFKDYYLSVNKALFYDNALWMDPNNPLDIRFCDLETGQESCYMDPKGVIHDSKNDQIFTYFEEKEFPLLERFEKAAYVHSWIKLSHILQEQANGILEISRYVSREKEPLRFDWDSESGSWVYMLNGDYCIDTIFQLPLGIDKFLPLISRDQKKQKVLLPVGDISSQGYSPLAKIRTTDPLLKRTRQKGRETFFEYDLIEGKLVPQSFDAKIYLIHLYLAKKQYQQAVELIQTISISEKIPENTVKLMTNLLLSSTPLHDFSPHACAVRLHMYHLFKKLDPFTDYLKEKEAGKQGSLPVIFENYDIYLTGQNNVEEPTLLDQDQETELIAFLLQILDGVKIEKSNAKTIQDWRNKLTERDLFIRNNILPSNKLFIIPQSSLAVTRLALKDVGLFYHYFHKDPSQDYVADKYFHDLSDSLYLSRFTDFSRCYEILRNPETPYDSKVVLYELATGHFHTGINENRLQLLSLVIKVGLKVPSLPLASASPEEQLNWYIQIRTIYRELEKENSTFIFSNYLKKFQFYLEEAEIQNEERATVLRHNQSHQKFQHLSEHTTHPDFLPLLARKGHDQHFASYQKNVLKSQGPKLIDLDLPSPCDQEDLNLKKWDGTKYGSAIKDHFAFYMQESLSAFVIDQSKSVFQENANFDEILQWTDIECQTSFKHEEDLKRFIKKLSRKAPVEFQRYVLHRAEHLGKAVPYHQLETILRAASQSNAITALKDLNPNLDEDEAHVLRSACIELMTEATHRQHLERIRSPLKKWIDGGRNELFSFGRNSRGND